MDLSFNKIEIKKEKEKDVIKPLFTCKGDCKKCKDKRCFEI